MITQRVISPPSNNLVFLLLCFVLEKVHICKEQLVGFVNEFSLSSLGITVCGSFCFRHKERNWAGSGNPLTTDTLNMSIFPELPSFWRGPACEWEGLQAGGRRQGPGIFASQRTVRPFLSPERARGRVLASRPSPYAPPGLLPAS